MIYISKIDNKKFNTKEQLIEHLVSNYILEDKSEGEIPLIYSKLKEAFPFADISIEEADKEYGYGEYKVTMIWRKFESDFTFYVGEFSEISYCSYSFINVSEAVTHYNRYLMKKDEIIEKLIKTYSPESVSVTQIFESDTTGTDNISFQMVMKGQQYSGIYDFRNVDEFVCSFKGYFDDVIEGSVVQGYDHATGYATVGGVPLNIIINRAKKMRIEILE